MHSTVQKASESKQQSKAKAVPAKDSKQDNTVTIDDQRPETAMQLKLMEGAGQSSRVNQLGTYQLMADKQTAQAQRKQNSGTAAKLGGILQRKEDSNGLPVGLRAGVESLSGQSMSDVTVHRNSDKPAQLQAHAYAQGTDIHLGPGQEQHLPHEAWHVAQQKQGRVEPTTQLKAATLINDDKGLEQEADVMGAKAMQVGNAEGAPALQAKSWENGSTPSSAPFQLKTLSIGAAQQSWGAKFKGFLGATSTFTLLTNEVEKYNKLENNPKKQGDQGVVVKDLATKWRAQHKDSKDPNDVLKLNTVDKILIELKGDRVIENVVEKGIFDSKEQVEDLGITEVDIEKKEQEEKKKGFVDDNGKISDKKGKLMNTSFMSDAESTIQGIVNKSENHLVAIGKNEKAIRSDAAVHSFFSKKTYDANTPAEREGAYNHANKVYNGGFIKNVISPGKFPAKGNTEITKNELDAEKLRFYQNSSSQGAKQIFNLNNSAEDDLATLISFAVNIQTLSKEEKEVKPKDENEDKVQKNRNSVLDLILNSKNYELKVEKEKEKSDKIIQPLYTDYRIAGLRARGWDGAKTATVSKATQMVSMGLISASAKYMTGGLASSEEFDLQEDEKTGELTNEVVHKGSEGESKYNFTGPRGVLKGMSKKLGALKSQASKFKGNQPITGFFLFSGALKEFEGGIAYIKQIVSTIKTWATAIGFAFPLAGPITSAIAIICQIINNILALITNSSKTARMIFNSMVRIMNKNPELWGLVAQNFAKSVTDMGSLAISEGAQAGYAAGQGQALENDAAGGVTKSWQGNVETDPLKIAAEAAKEKSKKEKDFSMGASAIGLGGDTASTKASDVLIGERTKGDKKGKVRQQLTKTFETTAKTAIPVGNEVIKDTTALVEETSKSEISNPQSLTAAMDNETTKLSAEKAPDETISQKSAEINTKKEEALVASDVSKGIKDIGEEVKKKGKVATQVSLINARVKAAKELEEQQAKQPGYKK